MKRSRLQAPMGFFLAALICNPIWGAVPPQPGTINYVEGQASIDGQVLSEKSVGSVQLRAGQSLSTQDGRAGVLLTPGVFFRNSRSSTVDMISPGLVNTRHSHCLGLPRRQWHVAANGFSLHGERPPTREAHYGFARYGL